MMLLLTKDSHLLLYPLSWIHLSFLLQMHLFPFFHEWLHCFPPMDGESDPSTVPQDPRGSPPRSDPSLNLGRHRIQRHHS